MKARLLLTIALLTAALPARPLTSTGCDQCADLPDLYRELLEQEHLRDRFQKWIDEKYYPISVSEMKRVAVRDLQRAMGDRLYGVLAPPQGSGGGSPSAAPAFGTNMNSKACGLVEYVPVKDADGKVVKDADGNDKFEEKPVTPQQVRDKLCKPKADFVLAHEKHHQDSCRAAYAAGDSKKLDTVDFFVKDDRDAYQAGIAVLREHIANLAAACAWAGSTNKTKPDGTRTVPTPAQVDKLQTNKRVSLLKRSTR